MNKRAYWVQAVAMAGILLLACDVSARGRGGGHGHGGGHAHKGGHSRGHIGIYVGPSFGWSFGAYGPVYGPGSFYGPAYGPYGGWYGYPPAVIVPARPPVYIERDDDAGQDEGDVYFCRKPEGYYPDVPRCPSGWERIPAQPPR